MEKEQPFNIEKLADEKDVNKFVFANDGVNKN